MRNSYAYLGKDIGLTVLYNGLYCYVDTTDVSLTPHLIRYGVWEQEDTQIFTNYLPRKGVFFDVGANIGYYSILASSIMNPQSSQIHAFDPIRKNMKLLEMSSRINGMYSITKCNTLGISSLRCKQTLHVHETCKGSSSFLCEWEGDEPIKCQMTTIDDYCRENNIHEIDFMKMDIEGMEYEALQFTETPIKVLLLEFNHKIYGDKSEEFYNLLCDRYSHLYRIGIGAELVEIRSFKDIANNSDFTMIFATNNSIA